MAPGGVSIVGTEGGGVTGVIGDAEHLEEDIILGGMDREALADEGAEDAETSYFDWMCVVVSKGHKGGQARREGPTPRINGVHGMVQGDASVGGIALFDRIENIAEGGLLHGPILL
jgi:hypothetical protein